MRRSKGFKSGTRYKLKKGIREKGKRPISKILQQFEEGDMVHIVIDPSVQKGMPYPRFHGKTGKVIEKRGSAYLVEVKENNAKKSVICAPVHLSPQRSEV
jgi:large subunit ribosomal protein L21e